MKRKHLFIVICAISSLFTACQEKEKPIPMSMELAGVQLDICGNQAGLVVADTTGLIIVRDSVANEAIDTIYNVRTNVILMLDSTFIADKMEEKLLLNVLGADGSTLVSLAPTDSMIVDSLMAFLKKDVGEKIKIGFAGNAEKSKFLKLENTTKLMLIGFSLHELDPEVIADPKITKMLDSYAKWLRTMKKDMDANNGYLPQMYVHQGLPEAYGIYQKLHSQESLMSPEQKERFVSLLKLHKSIDFP